ncbi:uncharacterized protein LAJ45_07834 [Morchella importuna]|uniref:uncharacterized protein n=1 Tax=Morchella importuna TaxID=1174673 RepID=UPI001E8EADCA|nr:uncharacterized protein LAJ45_07834 [Morchella importuna]KAH8148070.1 hypothetical protein LAJ45_07834 [Morchella importuna]
MDYEFHNANAWEETNPVTPVRKAKKPKKKPKKKPSAPPSVAGSVRAASPARSNIGVRIDPSSPPPGSATVLPDPPPVPPSPARSTSNRSSISNNRNASAAGRATSPARSVSSAGGRTRSGSSSVWVGTATPSRAQSVKSPSSVIAPSEYDDPWGENRKSSSDFRDDFYDGDDDEELDELDDPHTLSAYTRPIYYDNGDIWGEADPYEGPDGLRRENEGVRLERLGAAPNGHFEIAERRSAIFDERFFGPRGVNLRHIAQKTNTYVSMPNDGADPQVHIWGRPDQVARATRDLMLLSEHIFHQMNLDAKDKKDARKKGRPGREREHDWARVRAQPSERKQRYLDQERRREERQLDGYMLQVLGEDPDAVDKAVARLYGAFCGAAAKGRTITDKHLLHPPSMDLQNTRVSLIRERELENCQTIERFWGSTGVRALLVGEFPSWEFVEAWKTRREILEAANDRFIKKAMNEGLREVVYFRGYASLKINFGTLVLFGYKTPPPEGYSIDDFSRMVRDPMICGELIKHIGKEHIAKALITECHARKDLFHHVDRGHSKFAENPYGDLVDGQGDIHDIHDDLDIPDPTIEAHSSAQSTMGPSPPRSASRLSLSASPKSANPNNIRGGVRQRRKGPVDIKVMDLESDLAWQIEFHTYEFCPDADKYPIFKDFLKKIRIEEIPDESDPIGPPRPGSADSRRRVKRICYANLPGLVVDKIVQKTKHQYWISRTQYKFEITQYECFFPESIGPSRMSLTNLYPLGIQISWKGLATDHDVRWGASLMNADWTHNLAQQSLIGLGCSGDWEPEIESFFKSSGVGGFNHPMWTRDGNVLGGPDPGMGTGGRSS